MGSKMNLRMWLITLGISLGMGCTTSVGKVVYVDDDGPADFNNIQAAIDDANDGDSIIVQPGLYRECVRFHGKNIIVRSTNPGDFDVVAATIIDYGAGFVGTEDPNCALTGFKINGWISGVDYGIDPSGENHTRATISHCIFVGKPLSNGTVIQACDGTISNCLIADNRPSGDAIASAIGECHDFKFYDNADALNIFCISDSNNWTMLLFFFKTGPGIPSIRLDVFNMVDNININQRKALLP